MNFEEMKLKIKEEFLPYGEEGRERYIHTLGVVDTAEKLANFHGVNGEKAKIGALLHDCAKFDDYKRIEQKYAITIDKELLDYSGVIHSFLGYYVAKFEYKINDEEILNAVKYHTTGRANMNLLEKIIYLADVIEPNREEWEGLSKARRLAEHDLDMAMKFVLDRSIRYVEQRGLSLCPLTQEAFEYYHSK